jgi:hypothetical protein
MRAQTSRIRRPESDRGCRSINSCLGVVVMKCPRRHEGPGSPVSPGCNTSVVGVSVIREAKGMVRTVSARSDRFRGSMETIKTQWRCRASPRYAVQISPRRGAGKIGRWSFAIKVDLQSRVAHGFL